MRAKLKTKAELLKQGWQEDKNGSLYNRDLDDNIGYFSFWSVHLLGEEVRVIDYLRDFYIIANGSMFTAFYIPKSIVGDTYV